MKYERPVMGWRFRLRFGGERKLLMGSFDP